MRSLSRGKAQSTCKARWGKYPGQHETHEGDGEGRMHAKEAAQQVAV